jgi:hypothetical protein
LWLLSLGVGFDVSIRRVGDPHCLGSVVLDDQGRFDDAFFTVGPVHAATAFNRSSFRCALSRL